MIEAYIFSRKWPKLPESCSEYPSQTNWIWQLFRETMLPPLPGGCARAAIASAPASIIKCYFFDHSHTRGFLNISAFLHVQYGIQAFTKFKRPECTRFHLNGLQCQKFSRGSMRPKLPRTVRRSIVVLMGAIAPILPLYTISLGPLYHKIIRPPL